MKKLKNFLCCVLVGVLALSAAGCLRSVGDLVEEIRGTPSAAPSTQGDSTPEPSPSPTPEPTAAPREIEPAETEPAETAPPSDEPSAPPSDAPPSDEEAVTPTPEATPPAQIPIPEGEIEGETEGEAEAAPTDAASPSPNPEGQAPTPAAVQVTSLRLAASEVALRAKEVYTLTYTVEPAGTPVTWESSDSSLVRVRDGELTALAAGACRITLRAGGLAAQCAVTVTVPTLRMSVASQEVARGTFFAVAVEVSPANTPYTLSSSDETVLRQTSQGWQAVGAGSAEIVAATPEGVTSAVAMSVLVPIEKITFTLPALTMNRGERLTLNPQITPPDATHRALRYESSNQAVVTVSPEGVLVAQGAGAATVACSADGVTDWVDVTVVVPVTQVEVRLEKTLLKVGDLCKYTVTLYPADATDKSYTVTVDGGQPAGEGAFLCTAGGTVAVMVTAWNGIVGAQGATVLDLDALAREVFRLANGERVQMGLPELASSEPLTRAAAVRAKELPASFSHDRPDGRSCFTAYDEQGVRYGAAGENIAMGYVTAASVVEGWMNSPGHRANLLSWDFGRLGVGVELDAQGNVYWVQNFTD